MAVRIELFDPKTIAPSWLEKHGDQIQALSQKYCRMEGQWCDIPEHIAMYTTIVFTLENDGLTDQVVGFATTISFDNYTEWRLSAAMLDANYHEQHLGSAMTRCLVANAIDQGAQVIKVYTTNDRMRNFFTNNGFHRAGSSQFALFITPKEGV